MKINCVKMAQNERIISMQNEELRMRSGKRGTRNHIKSQLPSTIRSSRLVSSKERTTLSGVVREGRVQVGFQPAEAGFSALRRRLALSSSSASMRSGAGTWSERSWLLSSSSSSDSDSLWMGAGWDLGSSFMGENRLNWLDANGLNAPGGILAEKTDDFSKLTFFYTNRAGVVSMG
jgi:hypothetical protein